MAVDILRANYDDTTIPMTEGVGRRLVLPFFSDRYTIYGRADANPTEPPEDRWPLVNDFTIASKVGVWAPVPTQQQSPLYSGGVEWRTRQYLAQLGFKPDGSAYRKGFPLDADMAMSRVADLEPVGTARNGYVPVIGPVLSNVAPFTAFTYTAPGAIPPPGSPLSVTLDFDVWLKAQGFSGAFGCFPPFPWPRVLTSWRLYDVTNARRWSPRGSIVAGVTSSGPDWMPIYADGTVKVSSSFDSARFTNAGVAGSVILRPGTTYEFQVGHSEPLGGVTIKPNQRWTSAAYGNQNWVTGSPIPA